MNNKTSPLISFHFGSPSSTIVGLLLAKGTSRCKDQGKDDYVHRSRFSSNSIILKCWHILEREKKRNGRCRVISAGHLLHRSRIKFAGRFWLIHRFSGSNSVSGSKQHQQSTKKRYSWWTCVWLVGFTLIKIQLLLVFLFCGGKIISSRPFLIPKPDWSINGYNVSKTMEILNEIKGVIIIMYLNTDKTGCR